MTTEPIGLYVHIPICNSKCNYCDFISFANINSDVRAQYILRLCEEIRGYKRTPKIKVNTIFFGGGTPSLLTPHEMRIIVDEIENAFDILAECEFTVEANPKTVTQEKLSAFKSCGANRISFGLQSIHDNELKKLGRIHNFDDFLASYDMARSAGFDNISVDIMFGIPHQTHESLSATLDRIIALSPEHISAYGLILEEGTPFFKMRDTLPLPDEECEADMYELISDRLRTAGYTHYEISNFARAGSECRHNLKYWHDEEYIGVGIAAHSYFEGRRYGNTESMSVYLNEGFENVKISNNLTDEERRFEYAMMNLRLSTGLSLSEYISRFGVSFTEGKTEKIKEYEKYGLLKFESDRITLTERGFYLSNTVLSDLL